MVFGGFRGARKLLNTIRTHLDTAGAGLTLPNIETSQYSCFWECQCTRNDPQDLPCCPGPPQNTFIFFDISKRVLFVNSEHENLKLWNFETLKSLNLWNRKLWNFKTLKLCNLYIFETLKSLNLWNFEIFNFLIREILKSLKLWNL